jgi:hypothetical protein
LYIRNFSGDEAMTRKILISALATVAIAASAPALAHPGGGPGGGGGPGAGAGQPMTPPGSLGGGFGTSTYARDNVASSQGQFGRDFAAQQKLTADQYRALAAQHRADALVLAQAARAGANIPASAAGRIREALKADIQAWRDEFAVGRKEWQAMRDQWLVDRNSLTAQQWALQRANWFTARDAWIAQQKAWAMARRH